MNTCDESDGLGLLVATVITTPQLVHYITKIARNPRWWRNITPCKWYSDPANSTYILLKPNLQFPIECPISTATKPKKGRLAKNTSNRSGSAK